jgi:hypothetical protein
MGSLYGLIILIIERVAEVLEGSDTILLPSAKKGIEIALRTDEKRAKLPKKHKVIADFQLSIANFPIGSRKSKLANRKSKMC